MILAIDTSSAMSAVALIDPSGHVEGEELAPSGPGFDLPARYRALARGAVLTRVAVAVGPGSFTGTRAGVSFALGLAMGMKIPIVPLGSLLIQAARSDAALTAVADAGRGRVYHLAPGGTAGLAEPADVPRGWPLAGWLRPETRAAVVTAGLMVVPEEELRSFGAAVPRVLQTANEVAYGSLKIDYMQTFSARP